MLINTEFRFTLPDHGWVGAERHKLRLSVSRIAILSEPLSGHPVARNYSKQTIIAVMSGKLSSATAYTYAQDLNTFRT